jgi:hypothetical protein
MADSTAVAPRSFDWPTDFCASRFLVLVGMRAGSLGKPAGKTFHGTFHGTIDGTVDGPNEAINVIDAGDAVHADIATDAVDG